MKKFSEILKNQKAQFLVLAILLSLLIAVGGFIYYSNEMESATQTKENELKTLASLKSNQISDWLIDELNDAKLISRNIFLVESISKFLSTKNTNDKERVKKFLIEIKLEHDYHAIILADANSKILIATEKVFGLDPRLKNSIAIAAKEKKVITSDVYKCSVHHELHIDFVAPVIKDQKVIAAIVFQFNPAQKFFPLLSTSPTESYSTESYIGKKENDSVVVLSELKFKKDAVLKHKYSIKDTNSAIVKAVNGFTGLTDAIDYRKEEVVAYVNHIAGTNWYMVTKIDKKELYQDLTRESILLITFLIIIIASIFSSLAFIYSIRQRNTYKQLYYSQKEYLVTLNSIGDAVISTDTEGKIKFINQVAEQLTGWNHKDAIGKQLEEVFRIINEQTRNKVENPVEKVLSQGTVIGLANHTLLISKDGKEIPITDSGAPIKNDEGEILGVVLVFRDQTKEREAISKIERSEFRLNRAEIASKSGNWELHLDTKKIIGSKGACLIFGVSGSEFDYETIKKIPLHEYRPKLDEALKNLIEKNIPYEVEFKICALDSGEIKDIHSIAFYDRERKIVFGIIQDITETKKLQEALKLSEEKYRTISDLVSDYVFSTIIYNDGKTELDWVAGSFEEITGYTLEEYKSTGGWRGHLHPDDIEKDNEDMKTILNNNKVTTEIRTINKDGSIIWVRIYALPVWDEKQNRVTKIYGAVQNITKEKLAELDLKESEEKFSKSFNLSPVALSIQDDKNIFIDVNNAFLELTGYSREEVIGKTGSELNLWEDKNEAARANELFAKQGFIRNHEFRFRKKSGEIRTGIISAEPITLKGRKADLATVIDITELKLAKESLERSERKLRSLFAALPDIFLILDKDGRYIEIAPSSENLLYKPPSELLGKTVHEIFDKEMADKFVNLVRTTLETGKYANLDYQLEIRGKKVWFQAITVPYENDKVVYIATDITHRKESEEKIKEQLTELQRWYSITMNREERVLELKKEVNELLQQLDKQKKYEIT